MRKAALAGSLVILIPFLAISQVLEPVKWSFKTEQTGPGEATLLLIAKVDKGWHLYSQDIPDGGPRPTVFTFNPGEGYSLVGNVTEPKGVEEYDPNFEMNLKFFSGTVFFKQKIKLLASKPFSVTGTLEFMCCDDKRCLPPTDVDFSFHLPGASGTVGELKAKPETAPPSTQPDTGLTVKAEPATEIQVRSPEEVMPNPETKSESLWVFFIIALLAGFAGALTPCVYPMIPMTVTFFMSSSRSKMGARLNAIFYGLSIIVIYTVIGLLVTVLFGSDSIKNVSSHWITNLVFFLLFTAFAASFFGLFEIVLPASLTDKSDKQVDKGGLLGTFFMALTLVLVSFSCTAPFIGGILVEASSGSILKPTVGMFGFSLAFALPFTILAFFPTWLGKLPKSGGWLNSVKVVLGFVILALGMKYLLVPNQALGLGITRDFYIVIWIVLAVLLGLYLLGKIKFSHDSDLQHIGVFRLFLIIASFSFAVYLFPGLFGAPLNAVSAYMPTESSFSLVDLITQNQGAGSAQAQPSTLCDVPKHAGQFKFPYGLQGYFDYEQGLACAKKMNKPVFIDFTGHGCVNCKVMERTVWSDPEVLKRLRENFILIALYVDDRSDLPASEWITSKVDGKVKNTIGKKNVDFEISRFNVNAQPYYVLLDTAGNLLTEPRAFDRSIEGFIGFLDNGVENFHKNQHP